MTTHIRNEISFTCKFSLFSRFDHDREVILYDLGSVVTSQIRTTNSKIRDVLTYH